MLEWSYRFLFLQCINNGDPSPLVSPSLFSSLFFFVVAIWLPSKNRATGADTGGTSARSLRDCRRPGCRWNIPTIR